MNFYELQFELENACLLDCIHCSAVESRLYTRKYSDNSILKFLTIFDGKKHIYFTGGEPILYHDLLPLCQSITRQIPDTQIGLYTTGNGFGGNPISDDYALTMAKSGIVDCYFSIYHYDNLIHDMWTNRPGSLKNTIASLRTLISVGIIPKAHIVLSNDNHNEINNMIHFCENIGIQEIRFLRLAYSGNAKQNWEHIGLSLNEQNRIIKQIISSRDEYNIRITISGYPELHPCRAFESSMGCQAGISLYHIDLNGDVFPCACTKNNPSEHIIGNIIELKKIREYVSKHPTNQYNTTCLNKIL